jgi:hypothetical protein
MRSSSRPNGHRPPGKADIVDSDVLLINSGTAAVNFDLSLNTKDCKTFTLAPGADGLYGSDEATERLFIGVVQATLGSGTSVPQSSGHLRPESHARCAVD